MWLSFLPDCGHWFAGLPNNEMLGTETVRYPLVIIDYSRIRSECNPLCHKMDNTSGDKRRGVTDPTATLSLSLHN